MFLRIESIPPKQLIGMHRRMSLAHDRTFELWSTFMPRRKEIVDRVNSDLISMQVYGQDFSFQDLDGTTEFIKWAAVEVPGFDAAPSGMETYVLRGGLYAVFLHKGLPGDFPKTYQYIIHQWLPTSGYQIDKREQFELLGEKYKNNSPDSEEEIWIPVSRRE